MTKKREKGWKKEWLSQPNQHQPVAHRTVRWCTGQCPVPKLAQRRSSCSREFARRRGYKSPDCPVVHQTVRWANGTRGQRSPAWSTGDTWLSQWSDDRTGLSDVHRTVSDVPTDPKIQWSASLEKEGDRAPDAYCSCPVVHQTVWCTTRQKTRIAFQVDLQWLLATLGL
jgi:hypothetical protein